MNSELGHSSRLFRTFASLDPARREDVLNYLLAAWMAQFGRSPSTFAVDLELLSTLYTPTITAKRLRSIADDLPTITRRRPPIDEALLIPVESNKGFVTPEGRLLLEIAHTGEPTFTPSVHHLELLLDFYSTPRREWVAKIFVGGDLRPATIGFVVFLLLNGSSSRDRALRIPDLQDDEERIASAVVSVMNTFAIGLHSSALTGRELLRLRSNWAVSEARRQLPGIVRSVDGKHERAIYIESSMEQSAIEQIARALSRRRGFRLGELEDVLGATLRSYDEIRPLLKSWGMSWETEENSVRIAHDIQQATIRNIALGGQ